MDLLREDQRKKGQKKSVLFLVILTIICVLICIFMPKETFKISGLWILVLLIKELYNAGGKFIIFPWKNAR